MSATLLAVSSLAPENITLTRERLGEENNKISGVYFHHHATDTI